MTYWQVQVEEAEPEVCRNFEQEENASRPLAGVELQGLRGGWSQRAAGDDDVLMPTTDHNGFPKQTRCNFVFCRAPPR